jgi:hypothetical protein
MLPFVFILIDNRITNFFQATNIIKFIESALKRSFNYGNTYYSENQIFKWQAKE